MSTHNLFTINVDLSYADISGIYEAGGPAAAFPGLEADAWIEKIHTAGPLGDNIFYFKTDSLDAETSDSTGTDLMVAFNVVALANKIEGAISTASVNWGEKVVVNNDTFDADAQYVTVAGTTSGVRVAAINDGGTNPTYLHAVGNTGQSNTQLKNDLARYIAYQLTNGYSGLDIFSNETALVSTIKTHLVDPVHGVNPLLKAQVADTSNWTSASGLNISADEAVSGAPSGTGIAFSSSKLASSVIKGESDANDQASGSPDLGQFLQDLVTTDGIGDAVADWTSVNITTAHNFVIKLNFTNIAAGSHNASAENSSGGNNVVGNRTYLFKIEFPAA